MIDQMKKLTTMRSLFLVGLMYGAALASHAQDSDLKRMPFNYDNVSQTASDVQSIEVDVLSLRIQAPRIQSIAIHNQATAIMSSPANAPRMENIEVNLEAILRKPIGNTLKR